MSQSTASRAISAPKRLRYLLGYVAAFTYSDGSEWLLTKDGRWADHWPTRPENDSHVWKTREQAQRVAQRFSSAEFKAYVRPYAYETNNPKNAKGLQLLSEVTD